MTTNKEIIEIQKQLLESFQAIQNRRLLGLLPMQKTILTSFYPILQNFEERCKEESLEYNIFSILWPREEQVSVFLGYLLNARGTHSQGNLFLKEFLKILDIVNPDKGNWKIAIEKGKVDILLYRNSPKSVIVIENKTNGAIDQPNQLFRYYYREIYGQGFQKHNARIVYMPPTSQTPSEQSLSKPEAIAAKEHKVPEDFIEVWSYDKQIIEWLSACKAQLSPQNKRLHFLIDDFLKYCKL